LMSTLGARRRDVMGRLGLHLRLDDGSKSVGGDYLKCSWVQLRHICWIEGGVEDFIAF